MNRKLSLLIFPITLMLTGCDSTDFEHGTTKTWNDIQINGGKPVTLLCDLNTLMPTTNTVATEQSPLVFRSIQDIADEFMEMFPNVNITWAYSKKSSGDWAQWMTTQIASGDAPDIVMMHGSEYADREWFYELDDILDEPNIFVEQGELGSEHWKDLWPNYLWTSDMASDATGSICAIPITLYPGTATAYFYNKDMFTELGIEPPTDWEEFKNICKVIKDAGYTAVAPWSLNATANVDVWDIQYSLGPSYANFIKDQWDYDGNGYMTQDEMLRAVYEGVFYGQGKNRANLLDMFNQVKYKYNEILDVGSANTDYEPIWNKGTVGMMEDGMWRIQAEALNVEKKQEVGIFPSPLANSKTSQYCTDFEYRDGAYNPPIANSFNICKDATLQKGKGQFEAAKYFLEWLSLPKNIDLMVDEMQGGNIGAVYGTSIPDEVREFMLQRFAKTPNCTWPTGMTIATQDKASRYFQYWIAGAKKYDDNEFLKKYDEQLHEGCLDLIKALKIDTSGWKDGYKF